MSFLAITGALLGAASAAKGAVDAAEAAEKKRNELKKERARNNAWYAKNYYEDYLNTVAAYNAINRARDSWANATKEARARQAVIGGTAEQADAVADAEEIELRDLSQDEIDGFVQANIDEIKSDIEKHTKKQPKMGANIGAYKQAKAEWQQTADDLQQRLDYYNKLKQGIADTTRESERVSGGSDVLQEEQPAIAGGTESVGTGQQGGTIRSDVQGSAENGTAQQSVGETEQLSDSDIPTISQESEQVSDQVAEGVQLSDEVDENGRQFVLNSNGSIVFGEIGEDSGLTPAPILLSEGLITNPATNDGYGLVHIEVRHGEQIRKAGYKSVVEFVEEVAKNYEVIREGKDRDGHQTYILQLTDKHNNTLMVELSGDGTYWNINTAGIFKTSYGKNRKEVYNRHTTAKQSTETAEASQVAEQGGTQATSSINAPTTSSASEDTVPTADVQEISQESGENAGKGGEKQPRRKPRGFRSGVIDPRNMPDEERAQRGEMLRNAQAVDVNEGVIKSTEGLSARKAAEKWWNEIVPEPAFYDTEIGEVEISRSSIESSLAHRYGQAKLDAMTSLIDGFENAVYLGSMPDGTRHGGVMNHYFAYPINYAGKICYVFCRAMHDANKNRLYVHEVFVADNIKKGDTLQTAASQPHGGIALYKDILANVLDVKSTSSASEDTVPTADVQENSVKSGENAGKGGEKWNKTEEPEKFISRTKRHNDSHDITWYIGKKRYGSTTAERDLLRVLVDDYGSLNAVWNAYEQNRVFLSKNGAAILKKLIETNATTAELQQGALELDRENPAFEEATATTMQAVEKLRENGVKIHNATPEQVQAMMGTERQMIEDANERFNRELQEQIDGKLPKGHIYKLGMPSAVLQSAGLPYLPIELAASRLSDKSMQDNHPFELSEVKGLVEAVQNPLAIFRSATHIGSYVVLTEIQHDGRNYVVAIETNRRQGRIEINSVRSVHYRNSNTHIANWIGEGLLEYADKKRMSEWFSKQQYNSADVRNLFRHSAKVVESFENPKVEAEFSRVFHGSGAKFDKFDHSYMGTGEGAQAYGWGTYVTEVEGIGKQYANSSNQLQKLRSMEFERERIKKDIEFWENRVGYFKSQDNDNARSIVAQGEAILRSLNTELATVNKQIKESGIGRNLYTVEIPDDNGSNYLHWEKPINGDIQERVANGLQSIGFEVEPEMNHLAYSRDGKIVVLNIDAKGKDLYVELEDAFGSDKAASEFLNGIGFVGISYPAEATTGGRKDGARNYVIFNENDAQITDRVEFLRASNGTVYGWTVNGEIYLAPEGINPNTPVHEYGHLWAAAVEQRNPELWAEVKEAMKLSPVWKEVAADENYRNIWNDENRMASEVLSRISGGENYRRTMEQAINREQNPAKKFELIAMLASVKKALADFWSWVKKSVFGVNDNNQWQVFANSVIGDFYKGVNPNVQNSPMEGMFMGERGANNLDNAEEATIRLDNLAVAREMESAGKDAKAVKLATGWERGADGKWRYETEDVVINEDAELYDLTTGNEVALSGMKDGKIVVDGTVRLSDLVTDKGLFEAYPELRGYYVTFEQMGENILGSHDGEGQVIRINRDRVVLKNDKEGRSVRSTLAHEIQHAIQAIEGFARGGNSDMVNPETNKQFGSEGYKHLAGEVESRNVQERLEYSPEERRNSLAAETEDVARKDQIFIYDALESALMGSRVDARMAQVAAELDGRELTDEQRAVADVFGGKKDRLLITIKTKDGATRNIEMQQGNELAGAKHSLYKHFGTSTGVINSVDITLIPEVISKGERTVKGRKAVYKLEKDGVKYTVVTYIKENKEEFNNFYSNKKGQPSQSVNAEIGDTQSARITEELASADKGSENISNSQEDNDIRFRLYGGNSGYVGYSMSKRAAEAREEGRFLRVATEAKARWDATE